MTDYEVTRSLSDAIEKAVRGLPNVISVTSYLDEVSLLISTDDGVDTYRISITQDE